MQNVHPKESNSPSLVIKGPLATITLNRPTSANKLTPEDLGVLRSHIDAVNASNEVLVLVLRAEGKPVSSSCESGTCGTCRTRLLSGEAEHRDLVLTAAEHATNIMICVSRAKSGELVLDL